MLFERAKSLQRPVYKTVLDCLTIVFGLFIFSYSNFFSKTEIK